MPTRLQNVCKMNNEVTDENEEKRLKSAKTARGAMYVALRSPVYISHAIMKSVPVSFQHCTR